MECANRLTQKCTKSRWLAPVTWVSFKVIISHATFLPNEDAKLNANISFRRTGLVFCKLENWIYEGDDLIDSIFQPQNHNNNNDDKCPKSCEPIVRSNKIIHEHPMDRWRHVEIHRVALIAQSPPDPDQPTRNAMMIHTFSHFGWNDSILHH